MRVILHRTGLLLLLLLMVMESAALAAAGAVSLNGVRYHGNADRDRIVFDLSGLPQYEVKSSADGKSIVLEFANTQDAVKVKPAIQSEVIRQVSYAAADGKLRVTINLTDAQTYTVQKLANPTRIFIDIQKEYEQSDVEEAAPGLIHTHYFRRDARGNLSAHFLDVDLGRYKLDVGISNGIIQGRERLSHISDDDNTLAAINASYFNPDGSLMGITKTQGVIIGTMYIPRSAFAILADGRPAIGSIGYDGKVTIGKVTMPIWGVNCERTDDSLILYNSYFGDSTDTNEFGREFVVQQGKVTAISPKDTAIPSDGVVISVNGASRDAFTGVHVGDKVTIREDLGNPWNQATVIVGAGPTLVKGGQVKVTAQEEQFPADITRGRAPRTAVGILPNGHVLLAVVDGRQDSSIGCTLTEMGELMKQFGAVDAINFDGGGSSEMVLGGQILNSPSDGVERPLGCALGVLKK